MKSNKKKRMLTDFLREIDGDQMVKIGCKSGTNMIYAGESKYAMDYLEFLYANTLKNYCDLIAARMKTVNKHNSNYYSRWAEQEVEKLKCKIKECNTFLDREVIETYQSITENAMIIIIEGEDRGSCWTCEEFERENKRFFEIERMSK